MPRLSYALAVVVALLSAAPAGAQQSAARVGPFVVDLQGALPQFPQSQALADSRRLTLTQVPGMGTGIHLGAHVYPLRWRAVTFGLGGDLMIGRASATPAPAGPGLKAAPATTERLTTYSPQVSFNFGGANGWSYISAGLGSTTWSLVPDGAPSQAADEEKLKTLNYGGGARWFAKRRVGFSFDVRFHAINPGTASGVAPPSPRTTLLTVSAGISIR